MGANLCSVACLLPYHSFDPSERIFVQDDGSLGVVWKIATPSCEDQNTDALGAMSRELAQLLRRVPEGWSFEVIYRSTRDVGEAVEAWRRGTQDEGIHAVLAESRAQLFETLSIQDGRGRFVSRAVSVYVALKKPGDWKKPGWTSDATNVLRGSYEVQKGEITDAARAVEAGFARAGMGARRIESAELVGLVRQMLGGEAAGDDGRRLLKELAVPRGIKADLETGEILAGEAAWRVLSVKEVPLETFSGILTLETGRGAALDVAPECVVSIAVQVPRQEEIKNRLKTKKRLVFSQMGTRDGQVEAHAAREQIDSVLGEMFAAGESVLSVRATFIVRAKDGRELDRQTKELASGLASVGLEVVCEEALALTLFLQSLPLAGISETDRATKRSRTMTSTNAAHLMPVYGSFRGTKTPDMLLLNRRGEPACFSFFDNETAPHGIIAGVTGAGKSVFAQNLMLGVLRRGSRVFVLDRGNSYKKLCGLLGGRYLSFDVNRPVSVNPFGRTLDPEKSIFLTHLVAELATHGDRDPSPKESGLIVKALGRAFASGKQVDLTDVQGALGALGEPEARDLALSLELYSRRGPYGGFFNGKSELSAGEFTVCELGELALRKEIASPILMALIFGVTREYMARVDIDKYLVIDEAWTLLKTRNTARFLENVYRTYRKYRTCALILTQQVGDFEGSVGEAIRANAPNRVYLKQTQETILAMEKILDLNPVQKALLTSVESVKGVYSEGLFVTSSGQGVLRLVQDRLTYWLTTTDPADVAHLNRLIEKHGGSVVEALKEAACKTH